MGTRGLQIVRFRGRYYIQYRPFDCYYDGLGLGIVKDIPSDPEEYQSEPPKTQTNIAHCDLLTLP